MLDIPIDNVQIVHERIMSESKTSQTSTEILYQMSEVDLSFCDALAGMCSGEASSGPVNRPTTKQVEKTNA